MGDKSPKAKQRGDKQKKVNEQKAADKARAKQERNGSGVKNGK